MRLKCIFFVLACLLCTNNIQSQDIMDTLAISACECLQEDIGDFETEEERNLQLGMCILKAIGPNGEKLYEFYGEDFILDGNTGEKLGQQIGFRMEVFVQKYLLVSWKRNLGKMQKRKQHRLKSF